VTRKADGIARTSNVAQFIPASSLKGENKKKDKNSRVFYFLV